MRFADYHRTVVGFHGTTRARASRIVNGQPFRPSKNDDDWLGHGIYFWEYAPKQAWDWARKRYAGSTKIAVVGAMIRLGNCFDLLDPENIEPLTDAHAYMQKTFASDGKKLPKNFNAKKYLDCAVFETLYELQELQGDVIDTTRAVFVPSGSKQRLWDRSGLFKGSHLRLCVRDANCILGAWLVPEIES